MAQRNTPDQAATDQDRETPGRPKSESSRQQKHANQGAQTGNSEFDSRSDHEPRNDHHVRNEK